MRTLIFIVVGMLVTGCATEVKYRRSLDKWSGKSVDSLVEQWGAPDSSYSLAGGRKVLTYTAHHKSVGSVGVITAMTCKTTFYVDAKSVIDDYQYEGNDCRL